MSKVLSVRVSDEVAARVGELAAAQGAKVSAWLKDAVVSYLDDHDRGLPDAPGEVKPAPAPRQVKTPEEFAEQRSRLAALRAEAAGHAKRAREERERKYAERGW